MIHNLGDFAAYWWELAMSCCSLKYWWYVFCKFVHGMLKYMALINAELFDICVQVLLCSMLFFRCIGCMLHGGLLACKLKDARHGVARQAGKMA